MRRRLKIKPLDHEIARLMCESQRDGVPDYLVDLMALDGNGACPCEHFQYKLYPLVKAQLTQPRKKRIPILCLHLIDAREFLMQEILHKLIDAEKAGVMPGTHLEQTEPKP